MIVISSFRHSITVIRFKPGKISTGGIWTDGSSTTFTTRASVQPLKQTEVHNLPEGLRNARAVKIYGDRELHMADQTTLVKADRFIWQGHNYEVIGSDNFHSGVINHFKAIAVEVKDS